MSKPLDIDDWDIVVVSHNSGPVLEREWGHAPQELRDRVICVENGSSIESRATAERLFGRVEVVENRGLSMANNVGYRIGSAQYVLFANPDIRCQTDSLPRFRKWLDENGGLVGPRLVDASGSPQESCRDWPSPVRQIKNRLRARHHNSNREYLWPSTERGFVPWILGAAVATRREDLEAVGGWPEEYFLYFEDTELAWRYWGAGKPVALLEDERWFHAWSRESRGIASRSTRHHIRSAVKFYSSHPRMAMGIADHAVQRSRLA